MTAQVHENLIYEGEEASMAYCPPLPKNHVKIREATDEERAATDSLGIRTSCWRDYIGTWEVKDGRFYLVNLTRKYRLIGEEPLFADWFSGVLRIPQGEMLLYVHMGYGSVYEQEVHIKIENGVVIETRTIDNRGKDFDEDHLANRNMPGRENRFPGDDDF